MEIYILVVTGFIALEALLMLACLGLQIKPERTFGAMAVTAVLDITLIAWACALLF